MKIVCITTLFFDYVVQISNALSVSEDITLMLPDTTPEYILENISDKVNLYLFKYPRHIYYPSIFSSIIEIANQINRIEPDIIHFQVTGILPCLLQPFIRKYRKIATFHDIKPHIGSRNQWFFRFILYCARKAALQYIVHGNKVKEEMAHLYDVPLEKINVSPLGGYDVAVFKKYENPVVVEEGDQVLFFGTIFEYKGLEYLIKAEPMITKELPDVKIVIAGTGEDFGKYEAMMVNRENFIVHYYNIPYETGAELFQKSSVVVLPYIHASQSGVIPVAYGFHKPVVVTNVGSIPEMVEDGITGLIVQPRDSSALADAVLKLMKDEKTRKQMGDNGYQRLISDLSWESIASKHIDIYQKAINKT